MTRVSASRSARPAVGRRRQLGALVLAMVLALLGVAGPAHAVTITEFSAGITAGSDPVGIAAGPDGNLWFTETSGEPDRADHAGGRRHRVLRPASPRTAPVGIAAGPDGNLWFTEYDGDRIGRITPAGVVTEFTAGITAGSARIGIAAGPDGNLWFTEYDRRPDRADHAGGRRHRVLRRHHRRAAARTGSRRGRTATSGSPSTHGARIGRITPAGVVTEFSTGITPGSWPARDRGGPGRQPLVHRVQRRPDRADHAGGRRHRVLHRHHPGQRPDGIAAGPDGNLWFTEDDGDRIGRITPAGVVTEFSAGITPAAARSGSRRGRTATSGSPSSTATGSGGSRSSRRGRGLIR